MNNGECLPLAAIVGEDEMISSVIPLDQQELAEQKDDKLRIEVYCRSYSLMILSPFS
jgi:hypothetical protein